MHSEMPLIVEYGLYIQCITGVVLMTTTVQLLRLETTRALVACDCMRPLTDPNEISEPTRERPQRLQCQTFSTQWICEVQTMRNLSGWPHFVLVLIDGLTLYSEPWAHFVSFIAMGSLCGHICSMGSQRVLVACMVSRCVFYCGDMGSFVCNGVQWCDRFYLYVNLPAFSKCRTAGLLAAAPGAPRITRTGGNRIRSKIVAHDKLPFDVATLTTSMSSAVPLVLQNAEFNKKDMKRTLDTWVKGDMNNYISASGQRTCLLRDVFNDHNRLNQTRIEEGVQAKFDGDGPPGRVPTRILSSMLQPEHTVMLAWTAACGEAERLSGLYRQQLQDAACQSLVPLTDSTDKAAVDTADSNIRQFMIVTGNCSEVRDLPGAGTLKISREKQLVATHFDEYTSCIFVLWGSKTFRVCAPLTLECKGGGGRAKSGAVSEPVNERNDIDAGFCEHGEWYDIKLGAGDIMILPQNYWHEVIQAAGACAAACRCPCSCCAVG